MKEEVMDSINVIFRSKLGNDKYHFDVVRDSITERSWESIWLATLIIQIKSGVAKVKYRQSNDYAFMRFTNECSREEVMKEAEKAAIHYAKCIERI